MSDVAAFYVLCVRFFQCREALRYRPKGRRNIARPKKRWRDQLHFENQGTGNTPNPSGTLLLLLLLLLLFVYILVYNKTLKK